MVALLILADIALLNLLLFSLSILLVLLHFLLLRLVSLVEDIQLLYQISNSANSNSFGILATFSLRPYSLLSVLNVLLYEFVRESISSKVNHSMLSDHLSLALHELNKVLVEDCCLLSHHSDSTLSSEVCFTRILLER